jgi:hypothetical protein
MLGAAALRTTQVIGLLVHSLLLQGCHAFLVVAAEQV